MKATLPIYNSVQDEKPSKVYTCHRLSMGLDNKLNELVEETNEVSEELNKRYAKLNDKLTAAEVKRVREEVKQLEEKASNLTLETIRLFFPEFSVDEFNNLDPYDYQTFILNIGAMRNERMSRALKN